MRLQREPQQLTAAALGTALELGQAKMSLAGLREEPLELPERIQAAGRADRRTHGPHGR